VRLSGCGESDGVIFAIFTRGGSIAGLGAAREVADAALALTPGAVGGPVVLPQGALLFELVAKSGFDAAKFASERETTRAELRREETARLEGAVLRKRREESWDEDAADALADAGDDPEVAVQKADKGAILRLCLDKLSAEHKAVIDLVYYHELSVSEVSEVLKIPENTVKTRMFHARQRLQGILKDLDATHTGRRP